MTGGRVVIDTTRCIGCRACQVACKQWHSLPSEDTAFTGSYQNPPDMSGANLNVVKFKEAEVSGKLKWLFFKDQCRHCQGAWCKLACPRNAITQSLQGVVRIDPVICDPTQCSNLETKPCQSACFFNVPKYKYVKNGITVTTKMRKCDLCFDRFTNPQLPPASKKLACMVTCPSGLVYVGTNADLVATQVVNYLKSLRAGKFPNATVYPHQNGTWGPTHVVWILPESWRSYDLPGYGYY